MFDCFVVANVPKDFPFRACEWGRLTWEPRPSGSVAKLALRSTSAFEMSVLKPHVADIRNDLLRLADT